MCTVVGLCPVGEDVGRVGINERAVPIFLMLLAADEIGHVAMCTVVGLGHTGRIEPSPWRVTEEGISVAEIGGVAPGADRVACREPSGARVEITGTEVVEARHLVVAAAGEEDGIADRGIGDWRSVARKEPRLPIVPVLISLDDVLVCVRDGLDAVEVVRVKIEAIERSVAVDVPVLAQHLVDVSPEDGHGLQVPGRIALFDFLPAILEVEGAPRAEPAPQRVVDEGSEASLLKRYQMVTVVVCKARGEGAVHDEIAVVVVQAAAAEEPQGCLGVLVDLPIGRVREAGIHRVRPRIGIARNRHAVAGAVVNVVDRSGRTIAVDHAGGRIVAEAFRVAKDPPRLPHGVVVHLVPSVFVGEDIGTYRRIPILLQHEQTPRPVVGQENPAAVAVEAAFDAVPPYVVVGRDEIAVHRDGLRPVEGVKRREHGAARRIRHRRPVADTVERRGQRPGGERKHPLRLLDDVRERVELASHDRGVVFRGHDAGHPIILPVLERGPQHARGPGDRPRLEAVEIVVDSRHGAAVCVGSSNHVVVDVVHLLLGGRVRVDGRNRAVQGIVVVGRRVAVVVCPRDESRAGVPGLCRRDRSDGRPAPGAGVRESSFHP